MVVCAEDIGTKDRKTAIVNPFIVNFMADLEIMVTKGRYIIFHKVHDIGG